MIEMIGPYCAKSANNNLIQIGGANFYFSYKTVIAVRVDGRLFIRENDWGPTTGKHLNAIDSDKSIRMTSEIFEALLSGLEVSLNVKIAA